MKVFGLAALATGLLLFVSWPTGVNAQELDFGENGGSDSGSGEFSRFVPKDNRVVIGKIPVGINDLTIELKSDADLDIELWDGEVFVVGWEADGAKARVHSKAEITADYNGVAITWSGWNGIGGNLGNESITLSGTTKNTFVMKVFGYQTGSVKVVYSWVGDGANGPAASGSGDFSKLVPQNGRATIGTIPAGVDSLVINLTSANDLDIEIWDEKTFVVGWQADGRDSLIYRNTPVSGLYNGVRIAWSGWDGIDGEKGNEYIRISGTTQNSFLMKVFGYQRGEVYVDYSWGSDVATAPTTPNLNPAPTPSPTPAPAPASTPAPPSVPKTVKTWVGGFDVNWSTRLNWSPLGVPTGDERIVIANVLPLAHLPIVDIDYVLTTGTVTIGPGGSVLSVAKDVTFTNNGTITIDSTDATLELAEGATFINNGTFTAKGDLINKGTTVNSGVYNNEARIVASGLSTSLTNNSGGVLNNAAGGSSSGVITNACGGTINDSGALGTVILAVCIWTGAGGNDNWSNPGNWANDKVPADEHEVVINGEGSSSARVLLDIDLVLESRSLTVGSGDTLTIGSGTISTPVTLSVKGPGGVLINLGTVAIANYSTLLPDGPDNINNLGGAIKNACRGTAPSTGVIGAKVVQNACFWDGGGKTGNWSEAANWDFDLVPASE